MALSDEIQDAITRHQIFILRYAAGREKEASQYVDRVKEMIQDELRNEELTDLELARLNRFMDEVQLFAEEQYQALAEKVADDARELAAQEIDWNAGLLSRIIGEDITVPSAFRTELSVFAEVLLAGVAGATVRGVTNAFRQTKTVQLMQAIRDGVTMREDNFQIGRRAESVTGLHKKQAGSMIRTISNHVSVKTRDTVLQENIGLFDGYEWVAVLDSRTSIICAGRDGKIYPLTDDPEKSPKPPAHFNCRSTITPVVKAGFEDRAKKPKPRTAEGAKGKTKVRQTTTYESWLIRQPASFQDEVLGVTRGRLFRRGGLNLSKFVDDSGKTLTLDELRKVEPEVFNRLKL
jgi:SPP1 gp7 family putative phage head morphogenesis protein